MKQIKSWCLPPSLATLPAVDADIGHIILTQAVLTDGTPGVLTKFLTRFILIAFLVVFPFFWVSLTPALDWLYLCKLFVPPPVTEFPDRA